MKVFKQLIFLTLAIIGFWACKNPPKEDEVKRANLPDISTHINKKNPYMKVDTIQTIDQTKKNTITVTDNEQTRINTKIKKKDIAPSQKKKVYSPKRIAKISFENPVFDFGIIEEGEIIDHKFEFVNSGTAPLKIKRTDVTCGCTVPSFPFLDIDPGEKGFIGVQFNSVGKMGNTSAEITIFSNAASQEKILTLKGVVTAKKLN